MLASYHSLAPRVDLPRRRPLTLALSLEGEGTWLRLYEARLPNGRVAWSIGLGLGPDGAAGVAVSAHAHHAGEAGAVVFDDVFSDVQVG